MSDGEHPYHEEIRRRFRKMGLDTDYQLLDDKACQLEFVVHGTRRTLPLYTILGESLPEELRLKDSEYDPDQNGQNLTRVDMILRRRGAHDVPLIVEIEETCVNPGHIYGKFMTSAQSDYYHNGRDRSWVSDSLLFIQIVKPQKGSPMSPPMRRKWRVVEEKLRGMPTPKKGRMVEYQLYYETEGALTSELGLDIENQIRTHLGRT